MFSSTLTDREKETMHQMYLNAGFFTGSRICSSYTETFCFLCECLDIDVYYCTGGTGYGYGGHSWNKVKIDGTLYCIDTYWNAGLNNFNYFYLKLCGQRIEYIKKAHMMTGLVVLEQ